MQLFQFAIVVFMVEEEATHAFAGTPQNAVGYLLLDLNDKKIITDASLIEDLLQYVYD